MRPVILVLVIALGFILNPLLHAVEVTFINGANGSLNFTQTAPSLPETNWPLGQFSISAGEDGATLTEVGVILGGSYSNVGQFRLYENSSNDYSTATAASSWVDESGGFVAFTGLSSDIPNGTQYYWVAVALPESVSGTIDGSIPNSFLLDITNATYSGSSSWGYLNAGSDVNLKPIVEVTFICGADESLNFTQTAPVVPDTNWALGQFSLSAGATGATLTEVQVSLYNTYANVDSFRLYENSSNDYSTATAASSWVNETNNFVVFGNLNCPVPNDTQYYWVGAALSETADGSISGNIPHSSFVDIDNSTYSGSSSWGYLNAGEDVSLPVELASFSALCTELGVLLEWATESELWNAGFILDRQADDETDWTTIASYETHDGLKGQGNTSSRTEYEFTDVHVFAGNTYNYRLSDVDSWGTVHVNEIIEITVTAEVIPEATVLEPAYPNPFNPETRIRYKLAENANVTLQVVDLTGRKVRIILKGEQQRAGSYIMYWNGKNDSNMNSPSGVYFLVLHAGDVIKTQKAMLLR